jgi:hypothetical protein
MALLQKLKFESEIVYSFPGDRITAGIWIGDGLNDVIEISAMTKKEAADSLYDVLNSMGLID